MNVMIGIDPHKASHTAAAIDGGEDQLSRCGDKRLIRRARLLPARTCRLSHVVQHRETPITAVAASALGAIAESRNRLKLHAVARLLHGGVFGTREGLLGRSKTLVELGFYERAADRDRTGMISLEG